MSARMHFGELLYERHDYAAALEQFTLAVQREPRHSRVAWQALTLFKLGQVAQAQKLWNSLVAQEPRFLDPEWLKEKYWWSDSVIDDACALMREL